MTTARQSSVCRDSRLERALDDYLTALRAGQPIDRAEFLAQYVDLADDLEQCLVSLEFIHQAAVRADQIGTSDDPAAQPIGDYRLIREVGRGGMGVVYEAEQLSLGRRVALKILPFAATMDPRHLQRFHNEARAAASLHHEHIVPVYAVGCERSVHYYAMQFVEGQTLGEFIQKMRASAGLTSDRAVPNSGATANYSIGPRDDATTPAASA